MKNSQRFVSGGIYLVVDPSMELNSLLNTLKIALQEGVSVVQIWNNWPENVNQDLYIEAVCGLVQFHRVPVLINENWQKLLGSSLNGVHFDAIPPDYEEIKSKIDRRFITGITCGNNLNCVKWAIENKVDYISFCSMFPSKSAGTCEIVDIEIVKQARELTDIPIFLSGGINPTNIWDLKVANCDGVAVISGILSAKHPGEETKKYYKALKEIRRKVV